MKTGKAAIFDVDGTLFDYHRREIPSSAVKAIRELKEAGIRVIIATARSYPELSEDLLTKIPADYFVLASGHNILDAEGRSLFSLRFSYEQTQRVKEAALRQGAGLTLKYEDCSCLYTHPVQMYRIYSNIGAPRCPSLFCQTMDRHEKELPIGFTIWGEGEIRQEMVRELSAYPEDYRLELFGNGTVADIYSPRVTKMTALAKLTGLLGIPARDCIAFGDGRNDMQMIRWAGHGVAMGNACQELKEVADAVCGTTWEDGLARYLEQWMKV